MPPAPKPLAALALLALAIAFGACGGGEGEDERPFDAGDPNFVVLQLDDASTELMSARALPRTHRLLRERGGTELADYVFATPLCCPSRASLLTGQYAQNHGVYSNEPGYPTLREKASTLPAWLERDGYETVHLGKFLNGSAGRAESVRPEGWTEWQAQLDPQGYFDYTIQSGGPDGPKQEFGSADADYFTTQANAATAETIERLGARERPFFLAVDHVAPHKDRGLASSPCPQKKAALPARRDWGKVGELPVRLRPAARERDLSDKPSYIAEQLEPLGGRGRREAKLHLQCAAAAMLELDRGIVEVFEAIDRAGIAGRTVVVLVNDNGYFFGEHGQIDGKNLPYEAALSTPAFVWAPQRLLGGKRAPAEIEALTANIDLAPTILDLAGAEPCTDGEECRSLDGQSLLPLLRGRPAPEGRAVLIQARAEAERASDFGRACDWDGIRTADEVYVRYTSLPKLPGLRCRPVDERELYDLRTDPDQLDNAASEPGAEQRISALAAALDELIGCAGRTCDVRVPPPRD